MEIKRPILRYHGGKWLLAPWIISHFPKHRIYVEAFGGGGSVLLRKPRAGAEVYNDKWDLIVNLFQVLRNDVQARKLQDMVYLTPFARSEFASSRNLQGIEDSLEKARLTLLRSFAGFGSASVNERNSTGFRPGNRVSDGTNVGVDWMNYPDHIDSFVRRLRGVVIENRDYREVSLQHDSPDTLHFWDPPYVHDTRNLSRGNTVYTYEFSNQDHIDMAVFSQQLKGTVIICGYESNLYADLFKGWRLVKRKAYADGAAERTECLWINRKAQNTLFQ